MPLKDLLELLPPLPEFDGLRMALLHVSAADSRLVNGARPYATIDGRMVAASRLGRVLIDAEQSLHKRVESLYDAATIAFSGINSAGVAERIAQLVGLGAAAEAKEGWRDALAYYSLGERLAVLSGESAVLLRRRLGRACLNVGDMTESVRYYNLSLVDAAAIGDDEGQIIAATGLGNVASWAGRWQEADAWYERALRLAGESRQEYRFELMINRAMVANERSASDAADSWLAQVREFWPELTPTTRAGWLNIRGLVDLRRERLAEADAAFRAAWELATSAFHRAMILDNLAETALQRGDFTAAVAHAREAEAIALEHGSARALGEIYMRLGRCCAAQNDNNGVAFFEKAVELVNNGQYPLLLGRIFREYAHFRMCLGDREAARGLLRLALALFRELGAGELMVETENLLQESQA
jgi:tetratricopeptide (TPR) repeat protein